MRLAELAAVYLLVGFGCAVASLVHRRGSGAAGAAGDHASGPGRAADALLLAVLWPLYGPFLLLKLKGADHAGTGAEATFVVALRRARGTALGALLPDESTVHGLGQRLRVAADKIAEIDGLLGRPEFSEPATVTRLEELKRRDATECALAAAGIRLQNIRRLRAMRDRFARELDEVGELLEQLTTQAELVRLAGSADASSAELVREIVSRVEGLDQMLDDDPHLP
ncbi:MAG: hypothetical protein HY906_05470 [Deltaproteobacteria bacterium]|nr:hypothetical protein [Deltaproteobacteria bacterium]